MVAVKRFTEPGATHDVFAVSVGLYRRLAVVAEASAMPSARVPATSAKAVASASEVRRSIAGVPAMDLAPSCDGLLDVLGRLGGRRSLVPKVEAACSQRPRPSRGGSTTSDLGRKAGCANGFARKALQDGEVAI